MWTLKAAIFLLSRDVIIANEEEHRWKTAGMEELLLIGTDRFFEMQHDKKKEGERAPQWLCTCHQGKKK